MVYLDTGAVSLPIGPPVSGVVRVVAAGGEAQLGDGVVVDGQDLQLPAIDPDGVAQVGQAPQAVKDQPSHRRVRPFGQGEAEIGQVVDGEGPGQDQRPVGFTLNAVGVAVELVIDVPDQLFQQVLDGHDALGAAVFVDHDGQGLPLGLHASQGVQDPDRLGQGQGRADMVGDAAVGVDQVDQVGDPDDLIQVTAVDRGPAMGGRDQLAHRVLNWRVGGQGDHLATGHQHIAQ